MATLSDLARQIVSVHEGEILRREKLILELRKKLEKVKEELAAANAQPRAGRSPKCFGCIYKIITMKSLEKEKHNEK